MPARHEVIKKIFAAQDKNGFWKLLPQTDPHFPDQLHYSPNFRSTLWTLILLADLQLDPKDPRVTTPLKTIQDHFFDKKHGIYTLKQDHFPIPCLNGNMIYLDCYFNGAPGKQSQSAINFFAKNQRFDDGCHLCEKSALCKNTSCYGEHSCYWGVVKLFKGLSFIPKQKRTRAAKKLLQKCINFVLLHRVCYSSHAPNKIMIKDIDKLTFPNMYKGDFLEILWLLRREGVRSGEMSAALKLLKSKRGKNGMWKLEKKVSNLITSVGNAGLPNEFVTARAEAVLR